MFVLLRQTIQSCLLVFHSHTIVEKWARASTHLMCNLLRTNTLTSVGLSSRFKQRNGKRQAATAGALYRQNNNNKHRGSHPEPLMLLAKSTDSYKGSVWWREFDKWRGRKRRRETTWWKGRLGGFCGGIPDAPDAPVPLQTLPVACLSACQPAILSASLAETERGSERGSEEQRWARWCRGGTGEISGAQALPVKSDMTFWFCHLSPTAMSDSALRSACHPPLFSSASVSPSLRLSECLSVFFCLLLLPLHLLFLVLLFFSRVEVFMGGGKVEVRLSGGAEV